MSLKRVVNLSEGPMDYARGLVGGMAAAPQRARQTSAIADLVKAVKVLAQLLGQQAARPQQPQQRPQYSNPGATPTGAPSNMSTRQNTFSSFIQQVSGERLDEGVWDFVKGAGAHIRDKAIDKINKYAEGPSWLKDVVQAGKTASQSAEAGRVDQRVAAQIKVIQQMLQRTGGNDPRKALQRAVQMAGLSGDAAKAVFIHVLPQQATQQRTKPGVTARWTQGSQQQAAQQRPQQARQHGPGNRRVRPTPQ